MFVVTGVLMIFGLSALVISFVYYNITDGSLIMVLWVVPILLFLVIAILIILGWLSVVPPKFNRKEKTSFKIRIFNIIILIIYNVINNRGFYGRKYFNIKQRNSESGNIVFANK